MKTNLDRTITTQDEAEDFLSELFENGESFHPEDDAHQIIWSCNPAPTDEECDKLNTLISQIYNLPNYPEFDPCEYFCELHEEEDRRMNLARPETDPEKRHWDNHTTWLERDSDNGEDY